MKTILLINGHPYPNSFNQAIADTYAENARSAGNKCILLNLHELNFNPNLSGGYSERTTLEPDLEEAWKQIQKADHLVWVHPVWWGGLPALLKGFIDRLFLPGMAFKYRENSVWWDKLLTGKTARIICTADQPYWYYRLINRQPSVHSLKKMTLEFCGIKPVKVTFLGPIRPTDSTKRSRLLQKVAKLGKEGK